MSASQAGWFGTIVVHAALFAVAFRVAKEVAEPVQMVHAVTLIAAPAPVAEVPAKTVAKPTPVKNDKTAPILKPKKTPDKPKPAPTKAVTPPVKTPPVVTPPPPPLPGVTPNAGTDPATVKIEGFTSQHQEYVNNIMRQVLLKWGTGRPGFETTVSFVILPDGSVDVNLIHTDRSSGNATFDSDARATIETIGRAKLFGPLPAGVPELPISFTFKPKS